MKEKSLAERLVIDCEKVTHIVVDFIRKKVEEEKKDGVCLGLSGGIDSTVLTILAAKALGPSKVFALYLPDRDSETKFSGFAKKVANWLGIHFEVRNISQAVKKEGAYQPMIMKIIKWRPLNRLIVFISNKIIYPLVFKEKPFVVTLKMQGNPQGQSKFHRVVYELVAAAIEKGFNLRHIQRRKILEEYAKNHNFLLLGAANKSEGHVGWFVKDGVDDIYVSPLLDLYKTQVRQLARYLTVPEEIQNVAPSPDMWKGIGDKDIIGHSYETIDKVAYCLENGLNVMPAYAEGVSPEEFAEIEKIHKLSEWKRANPHEFPKIN